MPRLCLNLGAGSSRREDGWIHVDRLALPTIDVVHDLNLYPWPWEDGQAASIRAIHLVEHLRDGLLPFMDECHRLLYPGGDLYIVVPDAADLDLAWCDPTHYRPYRKHSFINYFTLMGIRDFHYTDKPWSFLDIQGDGHEIRVHAMPCPKEG